MRGICDMQVKTFTRHRYDAPHTQLMMS
jgi:hypothetical protein